mmetsp:Transcript_42536/g.95657  ORF Transcript_42536/g.95657 Transcript_42536/m.95657 type:complete len:212 (-) Transcript_42536:232-867(-)
MHPRPWVLIGIQLGKPVRHHSKRRSGPPGGLGVDHRAAPAAGAHARPRCLGGIGAVRPGARSLGPLEMRVPTGTSGEAGGPRRPLGGALGVVRSGARRLARRPRRPGGARGRARPHPRARGSRLAWPIPGNGEPWTGVTARGGGYRRRGGNPESGRPAGGGSHGPRGPSPLAALGTLVGTRARSVKVAGVLVEPGLAGTERDFLSRRSRAQ